MIVERTADLSAVLGFVVGRIEEQAMRSGERLSEDEHFLLNNLPKHSEVPEFDIGDSEPPIRFVPPDIVYERLCALAKAAYRSDMKLNPSSREWQFAFNVSKLNHHPMCWLLQWAGVKQRRSWSDRFLLILSGLLLVFSTVFLTVFAMVDPLAFWRWGLVLTGMGLMIFTFFTARRIEERQLKRNIEECRSSIRFGHS